MHGLFDILSKRLRVSGASIFKESCKRDSSRASGMRKHYFPCRELRIFVFLSYRNEDSYTIKIAANYSQ